MPAQRVTVIYPAKEGWKFDFDYYTKRHVPFVSKLFGKGIEVRRGISSATGSAAPYVCVATILTDTVSEFQTVFAKHGAEILGDVSNYTNIEPVVQLDEVVS